MATYKSRYEGFRDAGFRQAEYFPHEVVELAKLYPDSRLALERRNFPAELVDKGVFLQVNVYAEDVAEFPPALFTDDRVNWHRQQFGRPGLVGAAGLFIMDDGSACVTLIQSDVVQQVVRAPEFRSIRSRLHNRFRAWHSVTLRALVHCVRSRGVDHVDVPSADTITRLTRKKVDPSMFTRIYDHGPARLGARTVERLGHSWHRIDTRTVSGACYAEAPRRATATSRPRVCILHDIEENVDTDISAESCRENLRRMLDAESAGGARGTYHVLGTLFDRLQPPIKERGHALGFHSYDHDPENLSHLSRVREVDLQAKGYRPPRSVMTAELDPRNLGYWNFEWLASSRFVLGRESPYVAGYIAHFPVFTDDYVVHSGEFSYRQWRELLLTNVPGAETFVFSLHDCYAAHWIDDYDRLLDDIGRIADFATCDDVAGEMFRNAADRPPPPQSHRSILLSSNYAQPG